MKKKIIVINNKEDLNKFYDNIKYYRSFFYRFTEFQSDYKDIETIINALNIKNRFKRIRYVYDESCKYIDNFYKGKNMCNFNKKGMCRTNTINGCCRKCYHRSDKGCTTRNLTCKLFYCNKVCDKYKVLTFGDVKLIRCFPYRCQIIARHNFFTKEEDYLMDLYIGSILILFVRYFYRFIKQSIKKTRK
jgi:hypothetical protein